MNKEHNIYCPKCLERDGLTVVLDKLVCPQCHTKYRYYNKRLIEGKK
jgi:uncharacterized protein YbaR (Trm112 family)